MTYVNEDSFSRWIIEKSYGLTKTGLQKLSETFENIINRRVDIPEEIQRFQNTLQYARSKVDYVIGELICVLPSDMNLRIGNIKKLQ